MEDKGIAKEAIASAKRWLGSSRFNADAGNYDAALYSMEMAVEIAMKAVLYSIKTEVPKSHSIGDIFKDSVKNSGALPKELKENADKMVRTFNVLMDLRPTGAYIFETRSTLAELKKKYASYKDEAGKIIDLCDKAVR